MKTDVLFINPGNQKKTYQKLADEFSGIDTPVWILLMAEKIRNFGYSAGIYDSNVEGWDSADIKIILERFNPEFIVVLSFGNHPSASTQTMPAAIRTINDIKNYDKNIPIALGGTHPSALPEISFQETKTDYIISGNGIFAVIGIINYFKGKKTIDQIPDLYYKKNGNMEFTFKSDDIKKELDEELPGYAWDLLPPLKNYRAHNWHCFQYFEQSKLLDFSDVRSPYVSIYSSLGCPYSCSYCCINAVYGKPGIKKWSIEKVVSWIDILVKKHNIRNIRFADELFVLSAERVELFCDLIIERKYDLNIWVYGRIDTIKPVLLKKMKKAGINWIALGIESAEPKVRDNVGKKITIDIKSVVDMIKSNDIYVIGNFMFGLPEDDMTTLRKTYQLALDLNCEFINFYSVMAYPGSKLYEFYSEKPELLPDSWNGYSQHSFETKPLPSKYLSPEEILRFRDESFDNYFLNDKYTDMIQLKFGKKVVEHIQRMTKIKLKRKLFNEI